MQTSCGFQDTHDFGSRCWLTSQCCDSLMHVAAIEHLLCRGGIERVGIKELLSTGTYISLLSDAPLKEGVDSQVTIDEAGSGSLDKWSACPSILAP